MSVSSLHCSCHCMLHVPTAIVLGTVSSSDECIDYSNLRYWGIKYRTTSQWYLIPIIDSTTDISQNISTTHRLWHNHRNTLPNRCPGQNSIDTHHPVNKSAHNTTLFCAFALPFGIALQSQEKLVTQINTQLTLLMKLISIFMYWLRHL